MTRMWKKTSFVLIVINQVLFLKGTILTDDIQEGCIVNDFALVPKAIEDCSVVVLGSFEVPGGQTLQLNLKDDTSVIFSGNITFGYEEWEGPLVAINGSNALILSEDDVILDGQGQLYWDGIGEWGIMKPKFFIMQLHNSIMKNMHVLNPPVHCVLLTDSTNVELSDWVIDSSAGDVLNRIARNTDGFDVWNGTNIIIRKSLVHNQDDCVAIRCGANILVEEMTCLQGNGLSLSVGFSNDSLIENTLQHVTIRNSFLTGGRQAIHIKTHVDGGEGIVQNITYSNIEFTEVVNYGINIQENYRNVYPNTSQPNYPKNNIPIRDLTMENITGVTLDSAVPIYILCAEEGCFNWDFINVHVDGAKSNNCSALPDGIFC